MKMLILRKIKAIASGPMVPAYSCS